MAPLKVLVATEMQEKDLQTIAAAHPDVELMYTTESAFALDPRLHRPPSPSPFTVADAEAALREAEAMLAFRFPLDILDHAPKLKWIQLASAGANWLSDTPIAKSDLILTNASGVAAIPIAEWIICTMLMFVKRIPYAQRNRQNRRWRRYNAGELNTKTLGIVGTGHIGTELARIAKALGMRVLATRRSATGLLPPNVDTMYPRERMAELLAASDFVALCVPLTAETEKLIGEKELRTMKPSAYLFNVSRGAVIDEPVLIRALKEGWIAGAGLDVFEQEPLPAESEFWDLPNVILTPHVAGSTEFYNERIAALFAENIRRYIAGKELKNVVDKAMGY
jgi:phosphoglycerate dehydrogenase-like enzyme